MSKYSVVDNSLRNFDELQHSTRQHAKTVNAFIKTIKYLFHISNAPDFCRHCFFIRYGSNRERTVVSKEADFDLIMVLPHPFSLDTLYPTKFEDGVFMLNAKNNFIIDSEIDKYFTNENQRKLKALVLLMCLETLKKIWNGWTITTQKSLTNLKIRFDNERGKTLTIDVIPQIGANLEFDKIPGCVNQNSFHPVLQSYVNEHNFSAFYVLGFPPHVKDSRMKHLLLQTNFGLLELSGIECSENVRNTVRMCKGISIKTRMREIGLSTFHIKRMALLYLDEIIDLDPYNGVGYLLRRISNFLAHGYLPDYFFKHHNMFFKDKRKAYELSEKIKAVLSSIYSGRNFSLLQC
ncbi:hypothetical protein Avbf_02128 [Armadillidium vulgare]|nr:hypothetical protein Avbf_02128 [Armadillidium vulgare]